jgi:hypothetical protein
MIAGLAPAGAGGSADLVDRVNDVINADTKAPMNAPQADITSAAVGYDAGALTLSVRVKQFTDPLKDPNWASNSTYVLWSLDTNGDAKIDYEVNYGVDKGVLYGDVFKPSDPANAPATCHAKSAVAEPSGFYTVVLDPACLGNPQGVGFSVQVYYDTNAVDPKAAVALDIAPDQGLAGPVPSPSAATPPGVPPTFGAPRHAATAPGGDPAASPQPSPTAAPASAPAPAPRPAAPAQAPRTSAKAPATAATPATAGTPAAPATAAPASPSNLARTGANRNVAATGGALLALGGFALVLSARRQSLAVSRPNV